MRVIFNVDGKIFYRRSDFKRYLLKTGNINKSYPAKLGIYWMTAYLRRSKKSTIHSKRAYYDVVLERGGKEYYG